MRRLTARLPDAVHARMRARVCWVCEGVLSDRVHWQQVDWSPCSGPDSCDWESMLSAHNLSYVNVDHKVNVFDLNVRGKLLVPLACHPAISSEGVLVLFSLETRTYIGK